MSLDDLHGFDELAASDFQADGWSVNANSVQTGRFSGQCMRLNTTAGSQHAFAVASTRQTVGFGFRGPTSINATGTILRLYEAGTEHGRLTVNADGSVTVSRAGSALGSSAAGQVLVNTWVYIELDYTCHDTTGAFTLYVNGVSVASGTSLDTRNGGTSGTLSAWTFASANAQNADFDDVYTASGSTGAQGDTRIITDLPNADGASATWTPNGGSNHYSRVNQSTPDGDTTYVSDSTSGNRDTFGFPSLGVTGTVLGVMVHAFARKDDAGARSLALVTRSGGTNYDGSSVALGSTYAGVSAIRTVDPATSSAWTVSGVDSGEYGYKDI